MEPVMENVKADVEEQKQEKNDFTTNSDEVTDNSSTGSYFRYIGRQRN